MYNNIANQILVKACIAGVVKEQIWWQIWNQHVEKPHWCCLSKSHAGVIKRKLQYAAKRHWLTQLLQKIVRGVFQHA